jgi:pimeloyl-ACP methyl ester carboxylesterase
MPKVTVGDLEIAYDLTGSGPPVAMINGIGSPRAGWNLQVPALAMYFTVLTFDNRDVGETGPGSDPKPYAMRQFANDLAGLMDAIGWQSAHIVGASMGGAIAQEFAIGYPERTRSVSIVCSWPKSDPWMVELMTQWDHVFETQGRVGPNHLDLGIHGTVLQREPRPASGAFAGQRSDALFPVAR